jgi:hypothetical protein
VTTAEQAAATLRDAREQIAALAVEDGGFHVACARTGARPEPVAGATFGSYDDAEAAAAAAREYRDALAALDPAVPSYDLLACAHEAAPVQVASARERTGDTRANGLPAARRTATVAGARDEEWLRVENAPVLHLARDAEPVDDAAVERQLDSKL